MRAENAQMYAGAASDYERVGGAPAVRGVVDRFYELVLGDERLAAYFRGTDIGLLKRHQVQLVSQVMGGPVSYDGRELELAHAGLGITSHDFGVIVTYLAAALDGADVPSEIIARVGARLAATKRDVVSPNTR